MCRIHISDRIECRLLDYGVGVFVVRNMMPLVPKEVLKCFEGYDACLIYYRKKYSQKSIFENSNIEAQVIYSIIERIWTLKKNPVRRYSSNKEYKFKGLSYTLTIYHIIDSDILVNGDKEIDLLMNPSPLRNIMDSSRWESIKDEIREYKCIGYDSETCDDISSLIASWSAVALIEKEKSDLIEDVIRDEVLLQGAWFLFDVLVDNIENIHLSALELQRCKNTATNVFLGAGSIISANMSTSKKRCMDLIYKTSGVETEKKKCFSLLDNRIAIEKARLDSRQAVYGALTEMLLVAFTLVQIYDPIKNIITRGITGDDLIVLVIMASVFILNVIIIVRKDV